jgi:hypothetical protein
MEGRNQKLFLHTLLLITIRVVRLIFFLFVLLQAKYEEKFHGGRGSGPTEERSDGAMQQKREPTPRVETSLQGGSKGPKTAANGMIIRGMTFYKSEPDPMVADDGEPGENCESAH